MHGTSLSPSEELGLGRFGLQTPVARMNSWRQTLFPGNFLEKIRQRFALGLAQGSAERLLMLATNLSDLGQRLFSIFRQIKGILSPISAVWFPLHKSAAFQFIQDGDQAAGMDPQFPRQFLLADASPKVEQPQNARIRRRQTHTRQALRELGRSVAPHLGE